MQHAWEFNAAAIQFNGTTIYFNQQMRAVQVQLDPLGHRNNSIKTTHKRRPSNWKETCESTHLCIECVQIVNSIHRSTFCWRFFLTLCLSIWAWTFNRWFKDNVIISVYVLLWILPHQFNNAPAHRKIQLSPNIEHRESNDEETNKVERNE